MLKTNLRRAIDPPHAKTFDIAAAVTFLASPAARYVTGITLPFNDGWLGR